MESILNYYFHQHTIRTYTLETYYKNLPGDRKPLAGVKADTELLLPGDRCGVVSPGVPVVEAES